MSRGLGLSSKKHFSRDRLWPTGLWQLFISFFLCPWQIYCFENAVYYAYIHRILRFVKVFYLFKSLLMLKYMFISFHYTHSVEGFCLLLPCILVNCKNIIVMAFNPSIIFLYLIILFCIKDSSQILFPKPRSCSKLG